MLVMEYTLEFSFCEKNEQIYLGYCLDFLYRQEKLTPNDVYKIL